MARPSSAVPSLLLIAGLAACGAQGTGGAESAVIGSGSDASVAAAGAFLGAVHDSVRSVAAFSFESPERLNWVFVPQERTGLPFRRMRPEERTAAWALLRTGLSDDGYAKAMGIVRNEATLGALERAAGVTNWGRRDPDLYYTWIFGTPHRDSVWGWRFEGHHLSVNVTRVGGRTQIVAPVFMGANPARVPSGPEQGRRLLAAEEDLARELLGTLTAAQRARTILRDRTFGDIVTRNDPQVRPLAQEGLPASEMTPPQRQLLRRLLEVYAGRMAEAAAREQLARVDSAGFDALRFAWAGSDEVGEAHYYRIHGPTVLVEYDNTQNDANHIHSVWRDLQNDFGGDLLRRHYAQHRHPG
ncbi:MAG TPA: DUF3500 domain-containing protein [Longimicrobiaceae bacterium]